MTVILSIEIEPSEYGVEPSTEGAINLVNEMLNGLVRPEWDKIDIECGGVTQKAVEL